VDGDTHTRLRPPLGYDGNYTDTETGLQYDINRYYDPATGNFLTVDPLAAETGQTYQYADGDPLDTADPSGLKGGAGGSAKLHRHSCKKGYSWDLTRCMKDFHLTGLQKKIAVGVSLALLTAASCLAGCEGLAVDAAVEGSGEALAEAAPCQGIIGEEAGDGAAPETAGAEIPQSARAVLNQVDESGGPLSGYKGGSTFANDGRAGGQVLPQTTPGGDPITYQEWDVNPYQKGVNRGAERLVTGSDGSAWYTNDHYSTFVQVRGSGG
jgi:RHS repeat-associated protein